MDWIGLDVGGANIKIAWPHAMGRKATEHRFPMWEAKGRLVTDLSGWLAEAPLDCGVAATMTGELADCFCDKSAGVDFIVDAVCHSAGQRPVRFYRTDGSWCNAADAVAEPRRVAASNWHALAVYAGRFLASPSGFLIDIGSTTTDIIPIRARQPLVSCQTDFDRLRNKQLVYTGVGRSSVGGILRTLEVRGQAIGLANEHFATIRDVYLWLGMTSERPNSSDTADGRSETKDHAGRRLARMLCCDFDELGPAEITRLAEATRSAHVGQIRDAINEVTSKASDANVPLAFVLSGSGAWLAESILDGLFDDESTRVVNLANEIGSECSVAAAAHAVAVLAAEGL